MTYCINSSYTENKSFERVFLLACSFVFGVVIFQVKPSVHFVLAIIAATVGTVESGVLPDLWSAIVILGLGVLVSLHGVFKFRTGRSVFLASPSPFPWTLTVSLITLVIASRSIRARSWFCRTFRGEHEVASMLVPFAIGYTCATVWNGTWGVRRASVLALVLNSMLTLSTLAFMSPWHDDNNKHRLWITMSFVSAQLVCVTRTGIKGIRKWLPLLSVLIVCIIAGEIYDDFQQHYLHVIVLAVTLCQILYCLSLERTPIVDSSLSYLRLERTTMPKSIDKRHLRLSLI